MYAKFIVAALAIAVSMSLISTGNSAPLEGSIVDDANEDEMLQPVCDKLEQQCEDGKQWACRQLERVCDD
jgi:hypothetical protein